MPHRHTYVGPVTYILDEGACIDRNTWDLRGPGPHRASPEVVVVAVVVVVVILTKW